MGLGRSLALPGMRAWAENQVQVARETDPLTPGHSHPFRGRGEDVVFFVVVNAHVGRAKLLLSRTAFEHSRGLGRSLALPGMRVSAASQVQVARETGPLTPDTSHPFRGRGEDFVFFVLVKAHAGRAKLGW